MAGQVLAGGRGWRLDRLVTRPPSNEGADGMARGIRVSRRGRPSCGDPAVRPPSTGSTAPVIQPLSSEARKSAALATSSGSPDTAGGTRQRAVHDVRPRLDAGGPVGVRIVPGQMTLARTPCGP